MGSDGEEGLDEGGGTPVFRSHRSFRPCRSSVLPKNILIKIDWVSCLGCLTLNVAFTYC